jgi:hypothetical protein
MLCRVWCASLMEAGSIMDCPNEKHVRLPPIMTKLGESCIACHRRKDATTSRLFLLEAFICSLGRSVHLMQCLRFCFDYDSSIDREETPVFAFRGCEIPLVHFQHVLHVLGNRKTATVFKPSSNRMAQDSTGISIGISPHAGSRARGSHREHQSIAFNTKMSKPDKKWTGSCPS